MTVSGRRVCLDRAEVYRCQEKALPLVRKVSTSVDQCRGAYYRFHRSDILPFLHTGEVRGQKNTAGREGC